MTDAAGIVRVDTIGIEPDWSIVGSTRALSFFHKGDIRKTIPTNTTDYYIYLSSDYSVLEQSSYFEDFGTGVSLFINARFLWNSSTDTLSVPLPTKAARNQNVGSVIVSWEEHGVMYSTSLGKCYISTERDALVIESTIFSPGRVVHVDACVMYHIVPPPVEGAYT